MILSLTILLILVTLAYVFFARRNHSDENSKLCFYTVFTGSDSNHANVIHPAPSKVFPCYYFSNNDSALRLANANGWHAVRLDTMPVDEDDVVSATQAKILKAVPHRFYQLRRHEFTLYMDSKLKVQEKDIIEILSRFPEGKSLLLKRHSFLSPNVWSEFHEAMKQDRYQKQREQLERYINFMSEEAMFPTQTGRHFETGLILRNMRHPMSSEIGEEWLRHIERAGIECQVSFFFMAQLFEDFIGDLQ